MGDTQRLQTVGTSGGSRGTVVTSDAVANTKPATFTQIVASTPQAAQAICIYIMSGTSGIDFLLDIAVGASSAEQIICPDLLLSCGNGDHIFTYYFPIAIPAGTRISARSQSTTGGSNAFVLVVLIEQTFLPSSQLARITTYGANVADSGGTSIDPGATINTKGAWVEITASSVNPIKALLFALGVQVNITRTNMEHRIDIGIGAAGSEQVLLPDVQVVQNASSDSFGQAVQGPFFVSIPAGTRIAVRQQASNADATDRLFDVVLYGVD